MLAPKLFMLASSFALTLLTTGLFVIQPQTSSQDVDDDLPGRVEVLETQVAYLSTRVAALEAETPEPTQSPQDEAEADSQEDPEKGAALGAGLGKETAEDEADTTLADEYEPILADVDGLPCEYDAFMDHDVCSFVNMPNLQNPWHRNDGALTLITAIVVDPADEAPSIHWAIGYMGDDWLFLRGAIFLYDEQRYAVDIDYDSRYTDIGDGGRVTEIADVPLQDIDALIDIITADSVEVRLMGNQDSLDIRLVDSDRELLLQALAAYEQLGGHLPDNKDKLLTLIPSG